MMTFDCFEHAYPQLVRYILSDGHHLNAPRGFEEYERLGVCFSLQNPIERAVFNPGRKFNLPFCLAEAIWYLLGRNDLEFISYYAPRMQRYSLDGVTLPGTGYGRRIFHLGRRERDQWAEVKRLLKEDDKDSKRAVLQIFDGREVIFSRNIDVSCTLALQFLLRDGALDCVAYMRANDFYRGIVSDTFSFTFLQECMAAEIGAKVGKYFHMVGSAHIYSEDRELAERLIADNGRSHQLLPRFPRLPQGELHSRLRVVELLESKLRDGAISVFESDAYCSLPKYWRDVLGALHFYSCVKRKEEIVKSAWESMNDTFKVLLENRWPVSTIGFR